MINVGCNAQVSMYGFLLFFSFKGVQGEILPLGERRYL